MPRILATSAGPLMLCTSMTVPPLKSMPSLTPTVKKSTNDSAISTSEIGVRILAHFMNGSLVSSGMRRSGILK